MKRILVFFSTWALLMTAPLLAQNAPTANVRTLSGAVLLREQKAPNFSALLPALRKDWGFVSDSSQLGERRLTLYSAGITVVLQYVSYPMAPAEVRSAAEGAWLWGSARDEAPRHQAQLTVGVVGTGQAPISLYKAYTRVVAAVLENTRAYGVYLPKHYLLHSRDFFLQAARQMDNGELPVYCWVYFGMFQKDGLSCAYTYGLDDFDMLDLEIVRSPKSLAEAHAILYDAAREALHTGKVWKDGSILESVDGERFLLRRARSPFIEGKEMLQLQKL